MLTLKNTPLLDGEKNIDTARLLIEIGPFIGVAGAHRFYLRHYISATLFTITYLVGISIVAYMHFFDPFIAEPFSTLVDSSADNIDIEEEIGQESAAYQKLLYGYALCAFCLVWWAFDHAALRRLVREYNERLED